MKFSKAYGILKNRIDLDITFSGYSGYCNDCSNYTIKYDSKKLFENWALIIKEIRNSKCYKIKNEIKDFNIDIDSYESWNKWCEHRNILILGLWLNCGNNSHSYDFDIKNQNLEYDLKNKFENTTIV
jgi:hypothetical protein